MTLLRHTRLDS